MSTSIARDDDEEEASLTLLGEEEEERKGNETLIKMTGGSGSGGNDTSGTSATKDEEESDDDNDGSDNCDDYDSDEERDDFSISLRGDDDDETSFYSGGDDDDDLSSYQSGSFVSSTDDQNSVGSGFSGTTEDQDRSESLSRGGYGGDESSKSKSVAPVEESAVRWSRTCMYLWIVILGIVCSYTIFRVTQDTQVDTLEDAYFEIWTNDLGQLWQSNILEAFQALDSLSIDITATTTSSSSAAGGEDEGVDWPFETIPNYYSFSGASLLGSSALLTTSMAPQVTQSQRLQYENNTLTEYNEIKVLRHLLQLPLSSHHDQASSSNLANSKNNEIRKVMRRRVLQEGQQGQPSSGTTTDDEIIPSQIYVIDESTGQPVIVDDDNKGGPYYPIKYIDPINFQAVNYDLSSNEYMEYPISKSIFNEAAILGLTLDDDDSKNQDSTILRNLYSQTNNSDQLGTIVYPVFDHVNRKQAITTAEGFGAQQTGSRSVVGVIPGLISWNALFRSNTLPKNVKGIVAVIENKCTTESLTMQINGEHDVTYMGKGDLHDTDYDQYQTTPFTLDDLNLVGSTIAQVEFEDQASCNYSLTFYPSEETIAEFTATATNDGPKAYALGVATTFCIVLLVVCTFDCIQERRNQSVRKAAMEARAIVSSLFPAVVRDRLFETKRKQEKERRKERKKRRRRRLRRKKRSKKKNNKDESGEGGDQNNSTRQDGDGPLSGGVLDTSIDAIAMEMAPNHQSGLDSIALEQLMDSVHFKTDLGNNKKKKSTVSHPKHRLKEWTKQGGGGGGSSSFGLEGGGGDKSEEFGRLGKPIADLFPHTTVMFADIVGFTAWSSEREPEQVFTLLQTVYHAFDRMAKRRGVFKVETIGDCYVAVTGLPDPQPDHAVRMTKFARECTSKMTELTKKLEVSLGPDTGDLCMRLGLHSGPVTAGVLMGEKSRFQLFGDTVNTASRMESTGEKNRVQLSKSTADLLIEAGKSYWVKPREDLVHAKGKGQVQTFWLVESRGRGVHANNSINHETGSVLRRAPPRTRSALSSGVPVRGLQRGNSENLSRRSNTSAISQGPELNDRREERLIQWQVELFAGLLKKIVAAREEKEKQGNNDTEESENIEASENPFAGGEVSNLDECHVWTEELSNASESVARPSDRFSQHRDLGFKKPTRQPSLSSVTAMKSSIHSKSWNGSKSLNDSSTASFGLNSNNDIGQIVFDEVAEMITLPKFSPEAIKALEHSDDVDLGETVMHQLKDYVSTIAQLYRQNPFHNFEHASHVTMSAKKLLSRITIPENVDYERESNAIASDLHDYTYGITSDPLTQFAIVFSALVHDADHPGVPNARLALENPDMAVLYRNQSIAEQNSVDLAWDLFMDPRYKDLQNCVAANADERKRFRQLVVNSVMATDIFDKDMKELRNKRWDKAFHREASENRVISDNSIEEDRHTKATIVIEHIIQASDVAHTMQHWHIYQKWNERLFEEMFSAFECGRSDKNPVDFWYKGELWFFDNYVIPLAKKLEECNVFGVASDECLNYAEANRNEWSVKGEECVQQMIERYHKRKFFVAGIAKRRNPNQNMKRIMSKGDSQLNSAPSARPRSRLTDDSIPGLPKRKSSSH